MSHERISVTPNVPFLFTLDVHARSGLDREIKECLDDLACRRIAATFFVPAILGSRSDLVASLRRIVADGHQVGCHGLYHDEREDYVTDSLDQQIVNLTRARHLLEDIIGSSISVFRAPAFRISINTIAALIATGFQADLSVCAQRLSLLSSQISNYHWLLAPTEPYRPSARDPYRRGKSAIWEIPTSAFILPFTSTLHLTLGVRGTKIISKILHLQNRKPIVYMCHPEEFVLSYVKRDGWRPSWRDFLPTRRYGFPIRWVLYDSDEHSVYLKNVAVLNYLTTTRAFDFMTVDKYLANMLTRESVAGIDARADDHALRSD